MKKHKLAWLLAGALLLTACKGAEPAPGTSASSAEPAYSAPESSIPAGPEENQPEQALKKGYYWVDPEGGKEPEAVGSNIYGSGPYRTFWVLYPPNVEEVKYKYNAYFSNTDVTIKPKDFEEDGLDSFFPFHVFSYLDEDRVICIYPMSFGYIVKSEYTEEIDIFDGNVWLVKSDGTMQQTHLIYDLYQALKKEDETLALEQFYWRLEGIVFDRESGLHYALIRKSLPKDDSQYVRYFAIFDKEFNFLEYQPVDGALQKFGEEIMYYDWSDIPLECSLTIDYIGAHKILVARDFPAKNHITAYAIYDLESKELWELGEELPFTTTPWGYGCSVSAGENIWESEIELTWLDSGKTEILTPFPKEEGGKLETPFGEITVKKITRCPTAPDQSFMLFVECEEYAWQPPEANKRIWPEGTYTQAIVKYNMDGTKEFVAPDSEQTLLRGMDQAGRLLIYWDGENNG